MPTKSRTASRSASIPAHELATKLRQAITAGDLVPNQRLIEADIAEQYGASRGNVRLAFSELHVEGYIERIQNRGARVRAISLDEAIEIIEVRAAIEALCASKAAQRISSQEIEELRELGATMSEAVAHNEREIYSQSNQRLHRRVIEISKQKTAQSTVSRLRGQAVRYQFQLSQQPDRPAISLKQHLAIIEGICQHDPTAAAQAMTDHLNSVAQAIRDSQS